MSEQPKSVPQGDRSRRSERRRTPLVIDGKARRMNDGRGRIAPTWTNPPQALPSSQNHPLPTQGQPSSNVSSSFFRHRPAEPAIDLFTHATRRKSAASERPTEARTTSSAPLKISIIAGIAMALLFILPNLFGLTGTGSTPIVETPAVDAALGDGLTLLNIRAEVLPRGASSVLTFSGDVANASQQGSLPPPVEIVLTNGEGGRIVRRIEVTRRILKPGEQVGFSSSVILPDHSGARFALSIRPATSRFTP